MAGMRNGYNDVQVEFTPFHNFKIEWTHSYRRISLEINDYLSDAPEDVIASYTYNKTKDDWVALCFDSVLG